MILVINSLYFYVYSRESQVQVECTTLPKAAAEREFTPSRPFQTSKGKVECVRRQLKYDLAANEKRRWRSQPCQGTFGFSVQY